jgi:Flp pilus assembly protein TadG
MPKVSDVVWSRSEKGQTIILVAISIVSLLAMAALAIDVVTLYVARSEIQRAADAVALAGAKAIADSGITTLNSSDLASDTPQIETLARSMATSAITAALPLNLVAGSAPSLATGSPSFNFSINPTTYTPINSWQVTVTLQQTSLPTFFARIFARAGASTQATATAEAYNPGNIIPPAQFTPVAPRCVKPWLVVNQDPTHSGTPPPPFVSNGVVETGVIGEPPFDITPDCPSPAPGCSGNQDNPPKAHYATGQLDYMAATLSPNVGSVCPTCAAGDTYEEDIACCDPNPYLYLNCGGGANNMQWNSSEDLSGGVTSVSATATECLIHASNAGWNQGQDTLDKSLWPSGPNEIHAGGGSTVVSTSSSIVTIPIIDNPSGALGANANVTIVGFLQAFINCVEDGTQKNCDQSGGSTPGDINITVLNVIGCSNNPAPAAPVIGSSGASTIPVRLISP